MNKQCSRYLQQLTEVDYAWRRLKEAYAIASFDITSKVSPPGAARERAKTMAYLATEQQKLVTSAKMCEVLASLAEYWPDLCPADAGKVREYTRLNRKLLNVPLQLNQEFTRLKIEAETLWPAAKQADDFSVMLPYFRKMINYTREMTQAWCGDTGVFDALVYDWDGLTCAQVDEMFAHLKACIVPLLARVLASGVELDDSFARGHFEPHKQRMFCEHLLETIGFDARYGRLYESEHPFTSSMNYSDIRPTTHFYPQQLFPAIFSTLHEGGHGIYEQCIDPAYVDSIIGDGFSGGIHESSSRFWENMIGRSRAFWQYETPYLRMVFPEQMQGKSSEDMYRAVNRVNHTPIRISADELTYNLHIMIRYELEREIFDGRLEVADLPGAWAEKSRNYLQLTPANHAEGVLQDVHWTSALFGFFQSYTLGNINFAQISHTIRRALPVNELVATGQCGIIRDFLRESWYRHGMVYEQQELLRLINGEAMNAGYLCDYLEQKYSELYQL